MPVVFAEQKVDETLAEVLARHGRAAAARGGDREVRARHLLLQRRRRGRSGRARRRILVPSPRDVAELRPQAGDVGARGGRPLLPTRSGRRLSLRGRQLREPGHGRPHRRDPGRGGRSRRRRVPRPRRRARRTLGGVCLVTADHGNAEQMLEPDGVSPFTAHTTNPVPLVLTSHQTRASQTMASCPTSLRPCWRCSTSRFPYK